MMKCHLPSIEALTSEDEELLSEELRLSVIREHADMAREFLDEVDRRIRRHVAKAESTGRRRGLGLSLTASRSST